MANGQAEVPAMVVLPPQTALQLGGQGLNTVAAALGAQPLLLVIVLLNIVFASIGGYFLLQLERYRASNTTALIELMRACILQTAPLGANNERIKELESSVDQLQRER